MVRTAKTEENEVLPIAPPKNAKDWNLFQHLHAGLISGFILSPQTIYRNTMDPTNRRN
jgi:hypothetical protein